MAIKAMLPAPCPADLTYPASVLLEEMNGVAVEFKKAAW